MNATINRENLILLTDSYKLGRTVQYPPHTTNAYYYFESRAGAKYPETVFFGLQMLLMRYLEGSVVTREDLKEADAFAKEHFLGLDLLDRPMWEHIVNEHSGRMPIRIRAVGEGTPVEVSNVLMDVSATDPKCMALPGVLESLLTHVWAPSNTATISYCLRQFITLAFIKTVPVENHWLLDYMLHDFGYRGVSSTESAGMNGAGHLTSFKGTDTLIGIVYANRYYNAGICGHSVAATEHSVMTALGRSGETKMIDRVIKGYPKGILSVVSDSYDIKAAIKYYGTVAKEAILARDGKFVVRPDSPRFKGETPASQIVWIAQQLEHYFGATTNRLGFKELHPKVGIIYGDGLSVEKIEEAVTALVAAGYAASTCVYGMGGGLLQKHNRDTQRSAFKCAAQERDGKWHDVYKEPLDSTKASKRGHLFLTKDKATGKHITIRETGIAQAGYRPEQNLLETVFENGTLLKDTSWAEVRKNTTAG